LKYASGDAHNLPQAAAIINANFDLCDQHENLTPSSSTKPHNIDEVDTTSSDTTKNKVVSNSLAKGWEDHKNTTSGNPHGVDFIELDDTPSSYSGQAGKLVSVKSAEDGVEFTSSPALTRWTTTIQTFADGDTTPSVAGGMVFKTNNSSSTTITNFDDGVEGQVIWVIFGDSNTTIDFTDTNLKGNNGSDWSPSQGDHMTCVYDGTNWYCDVSDNTA